MLTCGSPILRPHENQTDHLAAAKAILPATPEGEPIFKAPWQARIFALMISIVKDQYIPWTSFQSRLVIELDRSKMQKQAEASLVESNYFSCWLEAAERTLVEEGFIVGGDIEKQLNEIKAAVEQVRRNQTEHIHS
jgi:nitrile hydratase accessory protein